MVKICAFRLALAMAAMMFGAISAGAQTVVDATTAEFEPSADHNGSTADGTALVTSYLLQFFPGGSSSASHSIDMGKPAPSTGGVIRFEFASRLTTPLVAGTTYQARVSAIGPGGTSPSNLSNPFAVSSPCAPSLSASSATFTATASTGSVSVTAGTGCSWTASSNASWITVSSGASGTGTAPVGYSVAANAATASRTGTLTIAGRTLTVTQTGVTPCTYAINPGSRTSVAAGESTSVSVTSTAGCAWTAVSGAAWITVTAGASGSGNGTVAMTIAANPATSQRTGTATIAGRTFTVTQLGASCTYTVTPGSLAPPAAGAASTLSIATAAGCAWSPSGMPTWITIATVSRTGPGTLAYTVAPNTGVARSATLTIAGRPVVVNQAAAGAAPPTPANFRVLTGQ
jgi:hypothetical protein